jgi:hypothetical protein
MVGKTTKQAGRFRFHHGLRAAATAAALPSRIRALDYGWRIALVVSIGSVAAHTGMPR